MTAGVVLAGAIVLSQFGPQTPALAAGLYDGHYEGTLYGTVRLFPGKIYERTLTDGDLRFKIVDGRVTDIWPDSLQGESSGKVTSQGTLELFWGHGCRAAGNLRMVGPTMEGDGPWFCSGPIAQGADRWAAKRIAGSGPDVETVTDPPTPTPRRTSPPTPTPTPTATASSTPTGAVPIVHPACRTDRCVEVDGTVVPLTRPVPFLRGPNAAFDPNTGSALELDPSSGAWTPIGGPLGARGTVQIEGGSSATLRLGLTAVQITGGASGTSVEYSIGTRDAPAPLPSPDADRWTESQRVMADDHARQALGQVPEESLDLSLTGSAEVQLIRLSGDQLEFTSKPTIIRISTDQDSTLSWYAKVSDGVGALVTSIRAHGRFVMAALKQPSGTPTHLGIYDGKARVVIPRDPLLTEMWKKLGIAPRPKWRTLNVAYSVQGTVFTVDVGADLTSGWSATRTVIEVEEGAVETEALIGRAYTFCDRLNCVDANGEGETRTISAMERIVIFDEGSFARREPATVTRNCGDPSEYSFGYLAYWCKPLGIAGVGGGVLLVLFALGSAGRLALKGSGVTGLAFAVPSTAGGLAAVWLGAGAILGGGGLVAFYQFEAYDYSQQSFVPRMRTPSPSINAPVFVLGVTPRPTPTPSPTPTPRPTRRATQSPSTPRPPTPTPTLGTANVHIVTFASRAEVPAVGAVNSVDFTYPLNQAFKVLVRPEFAMRYSIELITLVGDSPEAFTWPTQTWTRSGRQVVGPYCFDPFDLSETAGPIEYNESLLHYGIPYHCELPPLLVGGAYRIVISPDR